MEGSFRKRLVPFSLSLVIIILDQLSKAFITALISPNDRPLSFFNDFLWIVHQGNSGVAFSLGANLPHFVRVAIFIVIPLLLLLGIIAYCLRSGGITKLQRWLLAGVIGGGSGNVIDRIFRSDGVVDFVSVRIFGFLGMERWPTFNLADATVVVSTVVLGISVIFMRPGSSVDE